MIFLNKAEKAKYVREWKASELKKKNTKPIKKITPKKVVKQEEE